MVDLGTRQKSYEEVYDVKIMRRVPIIIRVNGKGFKRVARRLPRPYCPVTIWLFAKTMLDVAKEIDGCIFAYHQSDEISFVVRNDQHEDTDPWFANRIQKIASVAASTTTYIFNEWCYSLPVEKQPDYDGATLFDARVFAVPSISEAINNVIFRQQDCIRNSVNMVAKHELPKKIGKEKTVSLLEGKNSKERKAILLDKCGIDFDNKYPSGLRHGVAAYRIPKIVEVNGDQITRQRWTLDDNLPIFSEDREFISQILTFGADIFRPERDLKDEKD